MCCSVHPLQSGEGDWDIGEDPHRRATIAHSKPREEEEGSPVLLRRETVGADLSADKTDRLKVLPILCPIPCSSLTPFSSERETQTCGPLHLQP